MFQRETDQPQREVVILALQPGAEAYQYINELRERFRDHPSAPDSYRTLPAKTTSASDIARR